MRFTIDTIKAMKSWAPGAAGSAMDGRARQLEREAQESYVEIGLICCFIEDNWDWLELADGNGNRFPHFSAWLADAMPTSQSTAREAKTAIRNCKDHVPEVEMREMQRGKLKKLAECSPAVKRDPVVREKAKDKRVTEREFVEAVNSQFPDQHLEARGPFHLSPDDAQRAVYEDAMSKALKLERIADPTASPTKEELFEVICQSYIEQFQETAETSNVGSARVM